jgi:hypothetical protein
MSVKSTQSDRALLVRLEPDLFKGIAHLAIERGVTKSELVRQWLKEGLAKAQRKAAKAEGDTALYEAFAAMQPKEPA